MDKCTRIIPTRVGTSRWILSVLHPLWDHPHACGDKVTMCESNIHGRGSSPRVWGQEESVKYTLPVDRIIPTRVGTRSYLRATKTITKDHPHACGDKKCLIVIVRGLRGSSPRVWGQGYIRHTNNTIRGIIPTRVGTSQAVRSCYL